MTSPGTPLTNNVAKNSNDVVLLDFNITSQSAVDVEKVGIIYTLGDTTDAYTSNLELVCDGSIKNEWANPVEGTPLHTDTSAWTIGANDTVNCQVRVDLSSDATSTIVAEVDVSEWIFKDSSTGDSIATADIVPSADITGNTMTVVSASVTGSLAGIPAAQTWVAGSSFDSNGFNFAAGDAEDITITSITTTGYYKADGGDPVAVSSAMRDVVSSVELYANGEKIGETKTLTTAGVAIFNTLNWDIAAGDTEKLVVKVNTAKGSVDGSDDTIKFAITDASAEYTSDGTSLDATLTAIDEVGDITVYQTVTDGGTIAAVIDPDTPDSDLVVMGDTDVLMSTVKFTASNEDFVVEKLQVTKAGSDDTAYSNVKVRYTDSNGDVQTAVGSFTANLANFSNLDIFVEKDESATVDFLADLNTSTGGSTNNVTTSLSLTASEFRAVAQGSGTVDTTGDVSTGNDMYVYKSVPTVAFASNTPSGDLIPSANGLLARIDITADANEDITFASSTSNYITVQVATSGATISSLVLKDADGNTLDTAATVTAGEATFMIGQSTDSDLTIPAGQTKTVLVYGDITGFTTAGDTIQIWLDDADADIDWGIDGTGGYHKGNIIFRGDLYGGALVKP
jgi:hypothetical protein